MEHTSIWNAQILPFCITEHIWMEAEGLEQSLSEGSASTHPPSPSLMSAASEPLLATCQNFICQGPQQSITSLNLSLNT